AVQVHLSLDYQGDQAGLDTDICPRPWFEEHDTCGSQMWREGVSASAAAAYTESRSDFEDSAAVPSCTDTAALSPQSQALLDSASKGSSAKSIEELNRKIFPF
ncbi:hypothetical protein EK904_002408, partial [Melospiza melodia maxima]